MGEYSIAGLLDGKLQRFVGNPKVRRSEYFKEDLRQMAELVPALMTVSTEGHHQVLAPADGQPHVIVRRFYDELVISDQGNPAKARRIRLGPVGGLTAADFELAAKIDALA